MNRPVYQPSPETKIWYDKVREAFDNEQLLVAKNNFEKAIKKDSKYFMAHVLFEPDLKAYTDWPDITEYRRMLKESLS